MTSRDAILQRVHGELSKYPSLIAAPAPPEVWPRENPSTDAMAERFAAELTAVSGEFIRCASAHEARRRLAELASTAGWTSVGAMDRPAVRGAVADLSPGTVAYPDADWTPRRMAELSAGVVEAEVLLADTGSCVVACPTGEQRLLCYLPPACVVIAQTNQLVEHLPAAWAEIARRAADPSLRGEFVIITGPSRTADIEKILILGVHGPKRLVVLLVDGP